MNSTYLFVYGTLLKDIDNEMSRFLASHSVFVSKGYFSGKLYLVDWFPGAILSDDTEDRVFGSIFEIKNPIVVFNVLDDYEGIGKHNPKPHLFNREIITIFLENKTKLKSWVYLYNHSTKNLKRIISGNFLN
ncbi:MAG: gamma-glutamylcyclotransferase family protein [Flavobacteriaceae bacterium]|tara:strand:+ start:2584 stop:2979 length:396 start_codon:yes stop_codon:yes gene_type:complete